MENIVRRKGNKIWIYDKNLNKLLTLKNINDYRITRNFLEITTYNRLAKFLLGGITPDILKKVIINIDTLQMIYEAAMTKTPFYKSREICITDDVYLHPLLNTIYDKNNNELLNSVINFEYLDYFSNISIVKHIDGKYSLIYKDAILIKESDIIIIHDNLLFSLKDSIANVYTNYLTCDVESMICISSVKLKAAVKYKIHVLTTSQKIAAICIDYFEENEYDCTESEIRSLANLNEVIKISSADEIISKV